MKEKLKLIGLGIVITLAAMFVLEKLDLDFPPSVLAQGDEPCTIAPGIIGENGLLIVNAKYKQGFRNISTFVMSNVEGVHFTALMCKP